MGARLVTVAREISSLNANIIRARLEAEGIQCFVSGEVASSVVGLPANVGAFIDVQVLDFDAARAQSILQEMEEAARDSDEGEETQATSRSRLADLSFRLLVAAFLSYITFIVVGILAHGGALLFPSFDWKIGSIAGIGMFIVLSIVTFKKSFKQKQ